jgi:hypothetical protein
VEVFDPAYIRDTLVSGPASVCYNRQPGGLEDTLSNPSVHGFRCSGGYRIRFCGNGTSFNSVTAEVCVLIVDVA